MAKRSRATERSIKAFKRKEEQKRKQRSKWKPIAQRGQRSYGRYR